MTRRLGRAVAVFSAAGAACSCAAVLAAPAAAAPDPCASVSGNLVANCSFEDPAGGSGSDQVFGPGQHIPASTGPWVVASPPGGDAVDLADKDFGGSYPVADGNQSLDLNRDNPTGVYQDIATTAGQDYQLRFFLSGYPASAAGCGGSDPKTLTVSAGSASQNFSFSPDPAASPAGNQVFVEKDLTFTAGSSTTRVSFAPTNPGCTGPVIDNVSVSVPPGGAAPSNTTKPSISGHPWAGQVLSCDQGGWSNNPTSFGYQWNRDGSPISGATSQSYTVVSNDAAHVLTCTVTATNPAGAGSSTSDPITISTFGGCGFGPAGALGFDTCPEPFALAPLIALFKPSPQFTMPKQQLTVGLDRRPTIAINTAGSCQLSLSEALTVHRRVAAAAKKKKKRRLGLLRPVKVNAAGAGRHLLALRLTTKGKKLFKHARKSRKHRHAYAAASIRATRDPVVINCKPLLFPQRTAIPAAPEGPLAVPLINQPPRVVGGGQPGQATVLIKPAAALPPERPLAHQVVYTGQSDFRASPGDVDFTVVDGKKITGMKLTLNEVCGDPTSVGGTPLEAGAHSQTAHLTTPDIPLTGGGDGRYQVSYARTTPDYLTISGVVDAKSAYLQVNAGHNIANGGRLATCSNAIGEGTFHAAPVAVAPTKSKKPPTVNALDDYTRSVLDSQAIENQDFGLSSSATSGDLASLICPKTAAQARLAPSNEGGPVRRSAKVLDPDGRVVPELKCKAPREPAYLAGPDYVVFNAGTDTPLGISFTTSVIFTRGGHQFIASGASKTWWGTPFPLSAGYAKGYLNDLGVHHSEQEIIGFLTGNAYTVQFSKLDSVAFVASSGGTAWEYGIGSPGLTASYTFGSPFNLNYDNEDYQRAIVHFGSKGWSPGEIKNPHSDKCYFDYEQFNYLFYGHAEPYQPVCPK